MLELMQVVNERARPYPTVAECVHTVNAELHSLYLLSFLLTADADKAEQCLVGAIAEWREGIGGCMEWARSGGRQAVLKHAIQLMTPAPEHADSLPLFALPAALASAQDDPYAAVLLLDHFERFVFVMAILEGHSEEECAHLLRCSRRDVEMARILALRRQSSAAYPAERFLYS
jgi:hypothetical protein